MSHRSSSEQSKKVEDNCLLFDVEFLESISERVFVQEYSKSLQTFISLLNDKIGKLNILTFSY
jgi:DNA-dependent RNA polymerase auxiliary subunit epsilon